ncbi:MAG: aminopeptidase P N-terminal domain-containing protein [Burkholderiaceae bacterium]|nr:aminopeptidase P N-terminal domain-containing protein [Burkholderiaceae bacterium]
MIIAPYLNRRKRLLAHMRNSNGGIAIVANASQVMRNSDSDYPYRHDSSFYYLSGFTEPCSMLVLLSGDTEKSILFCQEKDLEREIWDGYRYGPQAAQEQFGFDEAHDIAKLDELMPKLLANQPAVWSCVGNSLADKQLAKWLNSLRKLSRKGELVPETVHNLCSVVDEMRLIKDAHEISIMRRAARISAGAHVRAMQVCKPGLREYQLEAELLHEFRKNAAEGPAYTTIVGTGANSCVLHYRAGNAQIQEGDMVLIDAGCELEGYASDITRSFPASGKFSGPQKAIYEIVLAAQADCINHIAPGRRFKDYHHAAKNTLARGLIDIGLLKGTVEGVIESGALGQFYMHGAGHWLGMDVHDAGLYTDRNATWVEGKERLSRILQQNMVLTIEPGLYIRPAVNIDREWWHIGVRIEDDAVVTEEGCELMSRYCPVEVDRIEGLMRH